VNASDGYLVTTPSGRTVVVDGSYVTLSSTCQAAGLTSRQTQVIVGVARGQSNGAIAAGLRVKVQAVEDALKHGLRLLEDTFEVRAGLDRLGSRELLQCLRNRRSCSKSSGYGGPVAQAFGTQAGDVVRRGGGTLTLLELVCQIQGVEVPMPGLRCGETVEKAHKPECRCPRCHRQREKAFKYLALGRNRRERRAKLFARTAGA
jgi:hypothetical protein